MSAAAPVRPGWRRHRWLLARRAVQLGVLGLFLAGPLAGLWVVKGSLGSSLVLGRLPLTDPLLLLQSLAAGHWPVLTAWLGAAVVVLFYAVAGGRLYCSWVCPINPLTDAAAWARSRAGLKDRLALPRQARLVALGAILAVAAASGAIVWETVNPVTLLQRGLVFATLAAGGAAGLALLVPAAVFFLDLFGGRVWCGHLCPVGAFYGLLGRKSLLVMRTAGRAACDDCMDCYRVCPEPQVLPPALKAGAPWMASADCTRCGRCIDVCRKHVFAFGLRPQAADPSRKGECAL